jgi:hypothetical protein
LSGRFGAIAQLGERFNGIEEVVGSIPSGSTTYHWYHCSLCISMMTIPVGAHNWLAAGIVSGRLSRNRAADRRLVGMG